MIRKPLGEILIDHGLITKDQLSVALTELKKHPGTRLGEVLVRSGFVMEEDLARVLALQFDMAYVPAGKLRVEAVVANTVSEDLARRHRVLPVSESAGRLQVATDDPLNVFALDEVAFATSKKVEAVIVSMSVLDRALDKAYRKHDPTPDELSTSVESPQSALRDARFSLTTRTDDAPVVRFVNSMFEEAVAEGASDIHVEPLEERVRIRFRVDGVLREITTVSKDALAAVVSRIKIMAQMDISERRIPQDGRIRIEERNKDIDIRVSTLPTVYGEKIVMRLLNKDSVITSLDHIGLVSDVLKKYYRLLKRPYGMILVTGPTGSGKTTTLTATLHYLNNDEVNIVTVEDPVEYEITGVNQVQINPKAGLTFATGLRSILRQDPNIIMVGEIRDSETAEISIRSALTGHLVFSTIHTNNSAGALTRLVDMDIEAYLVASAVTGILSQRLARKLCRCKVSRELAADAPERILLPIPKGAVTVYEPSGCPNCNHTGYKGRLALFELLEVSQEIRKLVVNNAPTNIIFEQAVKEGMRTLAADGVDKALQGQTSLEEVLRVAYGEDS